MPSSFPPQAIIHANAMHRFVSLCLASLILGRWFSGACVSGDVWITELKIARREVAS
jgi:hypothetical protein